MNTLKLGLGIVSDGMHLAKQVWNFLPTSQSGVEKKSQENCKAQILDSESSIIKLAISYFFQITASEGTSTKFNIEKKRLVVLPPSILQPYYHHGVTLDHLEPLYVSIDNLINRKMMNPKDSTKLLYLELASQALTRIGTEYVKKSDTSNKLTHREGGEKLIEYGTKIENYIKKAGIELGLNKFTEKMPKFLEDPPLKTEKDILEDCMATNETKTLDNATKTEAFIEVKNLIPNHKHKIIKNLFKNAIRSKDSIEINSLATLANKYMEEIDNSYEKALSQAGI